MEIGEYGGGQVGGESTTCRRCNLDIDSIATV